MEPTMTTPDGIEYLRTPADLDPARVEIIVVDSVVADITDFAYEPKFVEVDGLRMAYIDAGPADGPVMLLLHGEPTWSYLYRRMIPPLVEAGYRCIAPDLIGFGRSDKPVERSTYTYNGHVAWMKAFIAAIDMPSATLFAQDWGGLIGLRVAAEESDRFDRVAIGNTGLPYNPDVPQSVIEQVKAIRADPKRISLFGMMKKVKKMDGIGKDSGVDLFAYWQKYAWENPDLPAGIIASTQMEKRGTLSILIELAMGAIGLRKFAPLRTDISKAFEAPFPSPAYKMATNAMPSQVPTIPDHSLAAQKKAWEFFEKFKKPFLCVGAGNDPVTNGFEKVWQNKVPGTKGQPHTMIGGGHFFQWAKAEKLSEVLVAFIRNN